MSFQRISYVDPNCGMQRMIAILDKNQGADQLVGNLIAQEEDPNIAMLGQLMEVIENQGSAVQAEYETALQAAQDTIWKLQATEKVMIQQYALQSEQIAILQSQSNQTNIAHAAETKTAQERIKALEEALNVKCMEAYHLSEDVELLKKTVEIHNDAFSQIMALGSTHYSGVTHLLCVAITKIHTEKDNKLRELKEKDSHCIVQ